MGDSYPPLSDQQIICLSKGARLPVYLLLCNHPEGLTQRNLIVLTGMNDRTISAALDYLALESVNMIQHAMSADGGLKWFTILGLNASDNASRKNYDPVVDNTTPIIIIKESINSTQSNENNNTGRKIYDPLEQNPELGGKSKTEWDAIWEEFAKSSVLRNDRTLALAKQPHITVEYVREQREKFKAKKMGGPQWSGLFVKALEELPKPAERDLSIAEKTEAFLNPRKSR